MSKKRITVKYGGNVIGDKNSFIHFAQAIAKLKEQYQEIIVCHGGGPQISYWLNATNIESYFIEGQRHTNKAAIDVVEMALVAHVNKALVRAFQAAGLKTIGISGEDANLLQATQNKKLGYVGEIVSTNPEVLNLLLEKGYLPVIAPVACDVNYQKVLNVNADYTAAHIAAATGSEECIFMTNVDGILDENREKIDFARQADIERLIKNKVINGGMIPKVDCALTALKLGVQSTRIINGQNPNNLIKMQQEDNIGTRIQI